MLKSIAVGFLFLLTAPALGQDVMRYHVRHITVLAEDANTRVLRYAAKAGNRTPMHSHPASVVYVIKGGRVKITAPDGAVTIATLKTGTAALRPPVTHADEALDDVEMILVELKRPAHGGGGKSMTVRRLTRRSLLYGGAAGATLLAGGAQAQTARRPPNVIFFLADDMGAADISCYGAPQLRTPAIDSIAAAGARFTQAYANSAVCTASRVGIITGRYQYRLPIGLEEPLTTNLDIGLPPEQPTLPSLLRKAGYDTYLVGKWHLGFLPKYDPLKSGYEHFWGFRGGALDYFSHQSGGKADLWDDDRAVDTKGYLTTLIGERVAGIVRSGAASHKPWFISAHFNAPHWPWEGPQDEAHSREIGADIRDLQGAKLATYTKMVEAMDQQIGAVLRALEETGQADNTIVIFTSDNGGERLSNTWPFSGKKGELLEGGLRVPSVIRWPGHIRAGQESSQVIIHMDWLPTLLAAGGGAQDPVSLSDGISLWPVLTGNAAPAPRTLFWRFKANQQRAVRDGDYKALKIGANGYLFNVVDDPLERSDLKKKYPDIYKRLTGAWDAWNRTMLPQNARSYTYNNFAADWADHINTLPVDTHVYDEGGPWPT